MEPQIQYTRTDDGISIAYTTMGDGPPVLFCPRPISMQHLLSDSAPVGMYARELAARTRLTIFDPAGVGASQHDVSDFSLAAQMRAIEAVAARLAGDSFTLIGWGTGSAGAALYADGHHPRVEALACVSPVFPTAHRVAAELRENWSLARRHWADAAFPEGPVSTQRWYSKAMRDSATAAVTAAYLEEFARADLTEIYQRISVRTLLCVGQYREDALALASLVPDCRVVFISADGAGAEAPAAILEFMGVDAPQAVFPPASADDARGTAIILFTDIVDSTALTERLGDSAFRSTSRALDAAIREAMRAAGGMPVEGKVLGDGVMGVFTSATQAIDAARRCVATSASGELRLHVGLHAGDVIREEDNVYGGAVNIASRVCGLSAPGEILVSATVRDLARTSAGATFEDRGEHALKGIEDLIRVFAVRPESG